MRNRGNKRGKERGRQMGKERKRGEEKGGGGNKNKREMLDINPPGTEGLVRPLLQYRPNR